ncbi:MAG TPA: hypothetical protein VND20_08560, partial [Candidatus Binataceae bacterium]|nr:hypothetical protein [Candidatus Binataceae bacterium]
ALEAVYAYERAMSQARRRNFRANRTWQAIKHRGLTEAVEYTVNRPTISMGFTTLVAMGMEDKTFEAVVLRHPEMFSSHAVERSRLKLPQMVLPAH